MANLRVDYSPGHSPADLTHYFRGRLAGTPYETTAAGQDLVDLFASDPMRTLGAKENVDDWVQRLDRYTRSFETQFENEAGRPPTNEEYNQFISEVVLPDWESAKSATQVRQETTSLIDQFFRGDIEREKQQEMESKTEQMLAEGSPFDLYSKSYRAAVENLSPELMNFYTGLIQKVQPQLLTSMKAQNIPMGGAYNVALAGLQSDFAKTAALAQAEEKQKMEQNLAQMRYNIAAKPGEYSLQRTFGAVPDLSASGKAALESLYRGSFQGYGQQPIQQQRDEESSLLEKYGGMLAGGVAGGAGYGLGRWMFA